MSRPIRKHLSPLNLTRRGVPTKFHDITIMDYEDYGSDSLAKVREFVASYISDLHTKFSTNSGIMLYGSNGVGKSMLASIIVKEAYRNRYTSKRCTFAEYVSESTRVWNAKSTEERESIEEMFYNDFKAVEFLALEELGKELDTKLAVTVLEDLLRYREEKGLVTILCTNLSPDVIKDQYGPSVFSILQGNCVPVKIVGTDKRKEYFTERQ